jgi:ABC-2 type transport system ATP-binding protein
MLKVQKINKKYKKNKVLNDVSFQIAYGEIVGLLGSNGVGKTTLIKILCGLNRPNSGEIHLDDGCKISVVFDFNGLYMNFNAVENLRIFLNNKTQNKIDEFLKSVGLWEYRDVKVSKYSKGMLRKLSIIRALLTEPNILILDEPFDGIDVENKKFWIEFLRKWVKHGERAVLISSHILSEIEQMCSRTLLMSEGTIKCSLSEEPI